MTCKYTCVVLGSFLALSAGFPPQTTVLPSQPETPVRREARGQSWTIPPGLPTSTRKVLQDLIACESGGDPRAVNPEDKDGTPSLGLLQFKPSTLYEEGTRYGILTDIEPAEIMNRIYEPNLQIAVFLAMFNDNGHRREWWLQQFPGCYRLNAPRWNI